MTIDERLEAVTINLELGLRELEEHRNILQRMQKERDAGYAVRNAQMDVQSKQIDRILSLVEIDAENIRSLARIAERMNEG